MLPRKTAGHDLPVMLTPLPGGLQAEARKAVSADDLARLAWLLELLNRAPESFDVMKESDCAALEAEVAAFCESVGSIKGGQPSLMSASRTKELVLEFRGRILAMLEGSTFELEIGPTTAIVARGRVRFIAEPEALFSLAVVSLIEAEGQRMRLCARPNCGRLFVRRKRGLYCQRQCTQLEQFARYLARHTRTTACRD